MAEASVTPTPDVADEGVPDVADQGAPLDGEDDLKSPPEVVKHFRDQIALAKSHRRQFSQEWKRNVDLRLGRIANINTNGYPITDGDDLQTEINPDWYLTKTKTANLYSQTPQVQLSHENAQFIKAIAPFAKALNYELGDKRANVGVPMEEALNDVVNASGIAAVMVAYTARFRTTEVPLMDVSAFSPEQIEAMKASGELRTKTVKGAPTSYRFVARRISPTDALWPASFTGSDFNDADWVGHTNQMPWAQAKSDFNLSEEDKAKAISGEQKDTQDDLRAQPEKGQLMAFQSVKYDEIFYWRARVDSTEPDLKSIWRMVFVHGLETKGPQIDEPWYGQMQAPDGSVVGATKFPIQFLTLTYVSDNPVNRSDSAAARPQVNDLRRSRSQYFQNRQRSRPVRWFDVNRIDRTIQDSLMRGDYQGFIPTNGPGDRSVGEIARAAYPNEDMAFDRQTMQDLHSMWMIGQNQLGTLSSGEKTAAEVETIQGNFNTRIGQERALVQKFFLNIVEVLAGLMALYSDFPSLTNEEKQQMMTAWNSRQVLADLAFKIRPDSTIMLDSSQRIERLSKALNITAQSGVVDIRPIIEEILELSSLDPAKVMKQPEPPKPQEASISFRFSGKDDLMNPMVVAILAKNDQLPSPEDIQKAEMALKATQQGVAAVVPNAGQPQQPQGQQPPTTNGEPNASEPYGLSPKVAQRTEDMGNA